MSGLMSLLKQTAQFVALLLLSSVLFFVILYVVSVIRVW